MKKAVLTVALVVGVGVVVKRFGPTIFERLPEDAPPKWMFRNISAIRENTDRILEILEQDQSRRDAPGA